MPHHSAVLLVLAWISQPAPPAANEVEKPQAAKTAPAASDPAPTEPALPAPTAKEGQAAAKEAAPAPAPPPDEPETDADKFVKKAADAIDAVQYVDAKIQQTIRISEQSITSKGVYKKAPGYKARFELDVDLGEATGKRLVVSDGSIGYWYRKVLEVEELQLIEIAKIIDLIEKKDLPQPNKRRVLAQLPIVQSGDMLRGYLGSVTFTKLSEKTIGEQEKRKVVVVEGHWRKKAIDALTGRPGVADLESLGANLPQYVRLYIDAETSWPLKIELFRRDKEAEWKPVFTLEFPSVVIGKKIPDSEFAWKPPEKLTATNVTNEWLSFLQNLKDKPSAAAKTQDSSAAGAVSKPIEVPKKEFSPPPPPGKPEPKDAAKKE